MAMPPKELRMLTSQSLQGKKEYVQKQGNNAHQTTFQVMKQNTLQGKEPTDQRLKDQRK